LEKKTREAGDFFVKRAKMGEPPGGRRGAARSGFPFPEKSLDFSAKRCYHKTKGVSTGSLSATDRNIRICPFLFSRKGKPGGRRGKRGSYYGD
jgi:hypothetical protein